MKKRIYNTLIGLTIVVIAYFLKGNNVAINNDDLTEANSLKNTTKYTVTRVVDGDTIVLGQGEEHNEASWSHHINNFLKLVNKISR